MRFWEPFRNMESVRREIERAFGDLGLKTRPFSRFSFLPGMGAREYPLINVSEDKDAFHVEALAPGIDPEKLELTVHHGSLTISGEKTGTNGGVKPEAFHRTERAAGRFIRTVDLGTELEEKNIKAEYKDGLLMVTLPKAETAKPKQIEVKVA